MPVKVSGVGRLTQKLEIKKAYDGSQEDTCVSNFTIACKDGSVTEYVECTAWGKAALSIRDNTTKGSKLWFNGRWKVSEWEDKQSKMKHKKTYCLIDEYEFLDPKPAIQQKLDINT